MANSTLKMEIVTALDNAGIKATEQQIAGLEKQLNNMNDKSKMDKLERAFGGMPGKLGRISSALGGLAAKVSSVMGAFAVGWEIGTKINDNIIKPLLGIKDPIEELKKHNRELKKWQEEEVNAWQKKSQLIQSTYEQQRYQIDKTVGKINQQIQSYTRLARAASDLSTAG